MLLSLLGGAECLLHVRNVMTKPSRKPKKRVFLILIPGTTIFSLGLSWAFPTVLAKIAKP
jgi:hypothetical protein